MATACAFLALQLLAPQQLTTAQMATAPGEDVGCLYGDCCAGLFCYATREADRDAGRVAAESAWDEWCARSPRLLTS